MAPDVVNFKWAKAPHLARTLSTRYLVRRPGRFHKAASFRSTLPSKKGLTQDQFCCHFYEFVML